MCFVTVTDPKVPERSAGTMFSGSRMKTTIVWNIPKQQWWLDQELDNEQFPKGGSLEKGEPNQKMVNDV